MMIKKDWFNVLICLLCFSSAGAEVRITEIMTNNVSTVYSDKYNYDGFVEFFNDGAPVDLKGWTVTNMKKGKTEWSVRLDSSHILPTGYSLLFFGKMETGSLSASNVQNFYVGSVGHKLSTDEGSLSFENEAEKIEISYPDQYPHLSYCTDGFMMPTPGKANDGLVTAVSNRVAAPTFKSGTPGLYEGGLSVELACETDGAKIYYTLNGDAPTPDNGVEYNSPIPIEQTSALRARAFKDGMLYSEILTGSFILPDKYYEACKGSGSRLPIVSITANHEDIFGDMLGMYVEGKNGIRSGCYETPSNYNQDWMRSANFEYILDGKVVDNQEVEIGVYGGCTRIHVAKSLKIKANKRSGKNKMNYNQFFANRSYKKTKSLALRNGGNGYSYVQPRWRDMFIQHLAEGMNLDCQASQPVAFYLNGQFYGMMILTERTDEDYVYHNYGLSEDEIELFFLTGCEIGTPAFYDKMIAYVKSNYDNDGFYDILGNFMDIDEYIDYQILEQFVGNTDWVSNNIKFWRKRDGGKFRWIVYDTDFGLSKATSVDKDMIKFATSEKGTESMRVLLRSCLKNEDFRWRFLDQYLDRINNQFTDERIDSKLDSIWDLTKLDMCATIKNAAFLGAPGNPTAYDEAVEAMRSFAKERKTHVISQLKKEFGLGDDTVVLKVRRVFPNDEMPNFSFLLNKREHNDVKFNSWCYSNERVKVEPLVPFGYKISRWAINDEIVRLDNGNKYLEKSLTTVAKPGELKISIYFDYDTDCTLPSNLYLNEICASNKSTLDENGEASDWIELYNGGDKDVDIAGFIVENETKSVRCVIPSVKGKTVVPAHGYKLLWADKNPDLGPLHLNFKLGVAEPEKIVLRKSYRDADVELSAITYVPHNPDESYGRENDGSDAMKLFAICSDDDNEFMTSTPLAENGSIFCDNYDGVEMVANANGKQVFAVGKKIFVQNANGSDVRVYSSLGDVVASKKSDSSMLALPVPANGVYIVKIGDKCWKIVVD